MALHRHSAGRVSGRAMAWLAAAVIGAACTAASTAAGATAPVSAPVPHAADRTRPAADSASLGSMQPRLLAEAIDGLRPGIPGKVELFAVLAAYFSDERVFLREVEAIGPLLEERFGADDRVVTLANSAVHPLRHPMATPMNLATAIRAVASKMNAGEDVLLVYLTSHGVEGALAVGEWAASPPPLFADELGSILDRAEVPNIAAVISACRSGSFLPSLAAPDRLVITAAAADRNSFGCSDKRSWTYFGEAFFARALGQTRSLPEAFARAAALVRDWEGAADFVPSEPQIAEGAEIGGTLDRLAEDAAGP